MKVSTKLLQLYTGDFTVVETIAAIESVHKEVTVAVTSLISESNGWPLVRLVGEPEDVVAALADVWCLPLDEAGRHFE